MANLEDRLNKLREDRIAREKARIEKLRELNLKKYGNSDLQTLKSVNSSVSVLAKAKPDMSSVSAIGKTKSETKCIPNNNTNAAKTNFKRPVTTALSKNPVNKDFMANKNIVTNNIKLHKKFNDKRVNDGIKRTEVKGNGDPKNIPEQYNNVKNTIQKVPIENIKVNKLKCDNSLSEINADTQDHLQKNNMKTTRKLKEVNKNSNGYKVFDKSNILHRKSIAVTSKADTKQPKLADKRKSTMIPELKITSNTTRESVFDRLYKPKVVQKQSVDNATKLKTDHKYFNKVIKESQLITNRRQTIFEQKPTVRRSISAIHFKRVRKSELSNCILKWASINDNIDKEHLNEINEDESVKDDKVISAVKSERKKVQFQTPLPLNLNTPKPEELQSKLQSWLHKRGKSLDSYHHLQCFGFHHLTSDMKPLNLVAAKFDDDDENKENIALEHDSDNESYLENNNKNDGIDEEDKSQFSADKWRRASYTTDVSEFNETCETTLTSGEAMHHVDELFLGALNDLTELLREGFDWQQCARWLRAIRERFPSAPETAAYWECRAALEETRGDLNATVQCLEEAFAKGTKQSVVEANLDNLLDKFMQLQISPSGGQKQLNPKLVDVKNVFKSTIIRFAVQKAKLRQSTGTPKYTVTPVRRSYRLSRTQTPLRLCTTIYQAKEMGAEFKPNKALTDSP